MTIPEIKPLAANGSDVFDRLPDYPVACNNWPAEYPYSPSVTFRIFHDGERLYLKFYVDEQSIKAEIGTPNSAVYTDSCVEFFIALDNEGYYNFEVNPIGEMLMAWRRTRPEPTFAPDESRRMVVRTGSSGSKPFAERRTDTEWTMTIVIPSAAMFRHKLSSWSGVHAHANFYKCGDLLTVPHFLSWQPIVAAKPDFHKPEFFGAVDFA